MKLEYILMDEWLDKVVSDAWINRTNWTFDRRPFRNIFYYWDVLKCTLHYTKEYLNAFGFTRRNLTYSLKTQLKLNKLTIERMEWL